MAPGDGGEREAPFRAPERLAVAMPMIAVLGLTVVVSAVALGASGRVVALVAVGGFGLCALAPMALIEALVNRPLREALAQLRAARDGRIVSGPAFASGVLADLVHVARDLQAAQASLGPAALSPFPDVAAEGESQIARDLADIAETLKSMREAPVAAGFDGAVERLESMLVYIAETQERAEAKDRQFEGAFGRVEGGMADLAKLVARETETAHGALSSYGLIARNDIADLLAQQKSGRARLLERLDTLETRLAKGADGVAAELGRLAEAFRAQARLPPAGEGRLAEIAAALSRLEAEATRALARPVRGDFSAALTDAAANLSRQMADIGARLDATGRNDEMRALAEAAARFEAHASEGVPAELAGMVARGLDAIAQRIAARDETDARRLDALGAELRAVARAVAALDGPLESKASEALALVTDNLGAVARGFEVAQARLAAQGDDARRIAETVENALAEVAARAEAAARRQSERLDDFAQVTLDPARQTLIAAARDFAAARAQGEAGEPALARVVEAMQSARVQLDALTEKLPQTFAQTTEALVERLAARFDAAALAPVRDALTQAARAFDDARARLDDGAQSLARLGGDFAASGARSGRMLEEAVARMAALGFERLPDLLGDLAATQAQWRERIGEFDRSAAALAGLANADASQIVVLRSAFEAAEQNLRAAFAELAPGVEAAAAVQGDRIVRALDARSLAPALAPPDALDALRADLAALVQPVASRVEDATRTLARLIEERMDPLRRGELAPAALALQAATQKLGNAHADLYDQVDALKAALAGDRSAFAELRQDFAQAFAALAAGDRRTEALRASVTELAGSERAELTAVAQALGRIGERVEFAARAFEDRSAGDLVTLGADLTRDIDALARVTAERVLALEGGVETLALAAGATLTQVREATRAFSGDGLDRIVSRLDPLADLPAITRNLREIVAQSPSGDDWRCALDALGARLAETLDAVERRLQAQLKTHRPPASLKPAAVASLVVSMADALDVRFSQIEAGLANLVARLSIRETPGIDVGLPADVVALAAQLNSASRALKASLADFADASATLVEEADARRPSPQAAFHES